MKSCVTEARGNTTKVDMNKRAENQNTAKKKKMFEGEKVTNENPIDKVAETISFVIQGHLTPIKPTPINVSKTAPAGISSDTKKESSESKNDKSKFIKGENTRVKTPIKVQSKTAKTIYNESPKNVVLKDPTKLVKKSLSKSTISLSNVEKIIDEVSRGNVCEKEVLIDKNTRAKSEPRQKTTEKSPKRGSRDNSRSKISDHLEGKIIVQTESCQKSPKGTDRTEVKSTNKKIIKPKDINKEKAAQKAKLLKKTIEIESETKRILQKKVKQKNRDEKTKEKETNKNTKVENDKRDKTETKESLEREQSKDTKSQVKKLKKIKMNPIVKKKILTPKTSKRIIVKKKLSSKKSRLKLKEERRKEKLYRFWNAPKRHRVASLNAIAKVHCLYENESKALFDKIAEEGLIKRAIKQETIANDSNTEDSDSESEEEPCTRILRCVPGLRGAGKHWDPNASSSDESFSDVESVHSTPVKKLKIKKEPKEEKDKDAPPKRKGPIKGRKRSRRPKSPPQMDLKDMVVSKRMASLNASAILAASYSNEKKTIFSKRDSDTDDSSADEYFAALDSCELARKPKLLEEIKVEKIDKEEDRKLIEVHATPNKKVAVILNQEADVTITGVYVNSTTRSTHHEGYCSIAGMQYRISATSHTQTAATAVSTETVLQGSNAAQENQPTEQQRSCSSQSYAPLDALSNMQPPPGPGIHQQPPQAQPGHHVMPPMAQPQPHQMTSPQHRHHQGPPSGCSSSAFSSPHHVPSSYHPPPAGNGVHHGGHPPPPQHPGGEPVGYVPGYYQPAGPLITLPHGHSHAPPLVQQAPPAPPLSKSASLSDTASTTPSSATSPMVPQVPPPSSNGGDSSDNEVIITSVTAGTKEPALSSHSMPVSYRQYSQYPPPDPRYSYSYPAYHYPTSPPPNPYPHHHGDPCYPTPVAYYPKYATSYRRYLTASNHQYYQAPPGPGGAPEMYPTQNAPAPPPQGPPSQQVVTASPASTNPQYPPVVGAAGPPPPPTIMELYPPPAAPPTLVETTYQPAPPPPHHYYPQAYGIPPPPSCYSHTPGRGIPYATYQPCPCPMQSCPKNGHTGPLTGDGKRSNISKDSIPLPPVALALPLEPASATGPPSPARGSAGMPPPPSPAGAVYQPTPPTPKQESRSPETQPDCGLEKKRKARVGKAMVRSNMQQNTMLLMCNPVQNCNVKREIESPKDKVDLQKKEMISQSENIQLKMPDPLVEKMQIVEGYALLKNEINDDKSTGCRNTNKDANTALEEGTTTLVEDINKNIESKTNLEDNTVLEGKEPAIIPEIQHNLPPTPKAVEEAEPLPPCIKTVAENVKVKNMKRKQSMEAAAKEQTKVPEQNSPPPVKRRKLSSYKNIIKKKSNCLKISNGKNRLLTQMSSTKANMTKIKFKSSPVKRKLNANKEQTNNKRIKFCNKVRANNNNNNNTTNITKNKTAVKVLDTLIAKNNVDKTIDEVIKTISKSEKVTKVKNLDTRTADKVVPVKNSDIKTAEPSIKCKKIGSAKRKSTVTKCKEVSKADVVSKVPRKSLQGPRWSNGWCWEGEPFEAKVFLNSDDVTCIRKCYPMMRHESGDVLVPRDCVLLAGPKKNDLPFVAKIAYLWENPDDGEMMMSLLWYYRPEHTEQGRMPGDQQDEVFASKHKDSNSVACIDDKCYVFTFNEYCRYRKNLRRLDEGIEKISPCIPVTEAYARSERQPQGTVSPENIFFCRKVYDFRQKRIVKNPT